MSVLLKQFDFDFQCDSKALRITPQNHIHWRQCFFWKNNIWRKFFFSCSRIYNDLKGKELMQIAVMYKYTAHQADLMLPFSSVGYRLKTEI